MCGKLITIVHNLQSISLLRTTYNIHSLITFSTTNKLIENIANFKVQSVYLKKNRRSHGNSIPEGVQCTMCTPNNCSNVLLSELIASECIFMHFFTRGFYWICIVSIESIWNEIYLSKKLIILTKLMRLRLSDEAS